MFLLYNVVIKEVIHENNKIKNNFKFIEENEIKSIWDSGKNYYLSVYDILFLKM